MLYENSSCEGMLTEGLLDKMDHFWRNAVFEMYANRHTPKYAVIRMFDLALFSLCSIFFSMLHNCHQQLILSWQMSLMASN